jgi:hypothetical protein
LFSFSFRFYLRSFSRIAFGLFQGEIEIEIEREKGDGIPAEIAHERQRRREDGGPSKIAHEEENKTEHIILNSFFCL